MGAKVELIDVFNWYILNGNICGDICTQKFRHSEYIKSKLKNENSQNIIKKDFEIKNKLSKYYQYYIWVYGHLPFDDKEIMSREDILKDSSFSRMGMTDEIIISLLNNDKDFQLYFKEKTMERTMTFINIPIKKIKSNIINDTYKIVNMDNYFLKNKDRKKRQLKLLENLI